METWGNKFMRDEPTENRPRSFYEYLDSFNMECMINSSGTRVKFSKESLSFLPALLLPATEEGKISRKKGVMYKCEDRVSRVRISLQQSPLKGKKKRIKKIRALTEP